MKKLGAFTMMAVAAAMAGTASQPQVQTETTSVNEAIQLAKNSERLKTSKPAPAKPVTPSATQQRAYVKARPLFPEYRPVYSNYSHRRRVRYGKSRWIILA